MSQADGLGCAGGGVVWAHMKSTYIRLAALPSFSCLICRRRRYMPYTYIN